MRGDERLQFVHDSLVTGQRQIGLVLGQGGSASAGQLLEEAGVQPPSVSWRLYAPDWVTSTGPPAGVPRALRSQEM
jgi:hypothetical protein